MRELVLELGDWGSVLFWVSVCSRCRSQYLVPQPVSTSCFPRQSSAGVSSHDKTLSLAPAFTHCCIRRSYTTARRDQEQVAPVIVIRILQRQSAAGRPEAEQGNADHQPIETVGVELRFFGRRDREDAAGRRTNP
jgi:hypothetical protein